jgi:hypothetical protein
MLRLHTHRASKLVVGFTVVIVSYSLLLSMGSIADFPSAMKSDSFFPYLSDKPIGEDGFYMLTVAWNLALGKGISYNMGIATTGIQPLSTFIFLIRQQPPLVLAGAPAVL